MNVLFVVQLVFLLQKLDARLIVTPKNTTVQSGTQVTLECSTDSTELKLLWRFGGQNASFSRLLFTGNQMTAEFKNRYHVSRPEPGAFNLVFVATPDTASFYICEEPGGKSAVAEVKVLGEIGQNSSHGTALITAVVFLVLLVICLASLSAYLVNTKRKQTNDAVAAESERASADDSTAVGLSSVPSRGAAESEYVELPKKEDQCQRLTCTGDYTSLCTEEQYTKLNEYADLGV